MRGSGFSDAALAGFVGTGAMTVAMLLMPALGIREVNVPGILSALLHVPLFLGLLAHFGAGILLAMAYARLLTRLHRTPSWLGGLGYAMIPWLMWQVVLDPLTGLGPFALNAGFPAGTTFATLIGHAVYGIVMGGLIERLESRSVPVSVPRENRNASGREPELDRSRMHDWRRG